MLRRKRGWIAAAFAVGLAIVAMPQPSQAQGFHLSIGSGFGPAFGPGFGGYGYGYGVPRYGYGYGRGLGGYSAFRPPVIVVPPHSRHGRYHVPPVYRHGHYHGPFPGHGYRHPHGHRRGW